MLIKVKIRRLEGEDVIITMDDAENIAVLKEKLNDQLDIEPSQQRLIFRGHVLDDNCSIVDYEIGNENVVHLVKRPPREPFKNENPPDTPQANAPPNETSGAGHIHVSHGDQAYLSPTAIRLRILRTIVNEIRTGLEDLEAESIDEMSLDPPPEQTNLQTFEELVSDVHVLDQRFGVHRESFLTLLRNLEAGNSNNLSEDVIQDRMRFSEHINSIYHNMSHAFHLISDITFLHTSDGANISSEVFLREPQNQISNILRHSNNITNVDANLNETFQFGTDNTHTIPEFLLDMEVEPQTNVELAEMNSENAHEYLRNLDHRMRQVIPSGMDLEMDLEDFSEFENQLLLQQNEQSPLIGNMPADLIQQIVTSIQRNASGNWSNADPEHLQNAAGPSTLIINTGPDRNSATRTIPIMHIVYDQTSPCESRHTRGPLQARSGINPAEFPIQHNEATTTRTLVTVQSLYERFDRNPRLPDSQVISYFLLLRESLVPEALRYLTNQEIRQVGASALEYFQNILQYLDNIQPIGVVVDVVMGLQSHFLCRIPSMISLSPLINMTESIRAVLNHHMPAIINLIIIQDSGEFCQSILSIIPMVFMDLCVILYNCVDGCEANLEVILRAYMCECLSDMDETNKDLVLNLGFYMISMGVYRAGFPSLRSMQFIIPNNQSQNDDNTSPQLAMPIADTRKILSARKRRSARLVPDTVQQQQGVSPIRKLASASTSSTSKAAASTSDVKIAEPSTSTAGDSTASTSADTEPSTSYAYVAQPSKSSVNTAPPSKSSVNTAPPSKSSVNTAPPSKSSVNTATPSKSSVNTATPSKSSVNTATPSKSSVNTAPPSKSSVNTATPSKSSVNTATPSKSSVNTAPPSKSSINIVQPSTSSVKFEPSTSSVKFEPSTSSVKFEPSTSSVKFEPSTSNVTTVASATGTPSMKSEHKWITFADLFASVTRTDEADAVNSSPRSSRVASTDDEISRMCCVPIETVHISPMSDAYLQGKPQTSQDAIRYRKPSSQPELFADEILNSFAEDIVPNQQLYAMFKKFLRDCIDVRFQLSPNYNERRCLAMRLLTDSSISSDKARRLFKKLRKHMQLMKKPKRLR